MSVITVSKGDIIHTVGNGVAIVTQVGVEGIYAIPEFAENAEFLSYNSFGVEWNLGK